MLSRGQKSETFGHIVPSTENTGNFLQSLMGCLCKLPDLHLLDTGQVQQPPPSLQTYGNSYLPLFSEKNRKKREKIRENHCPSATW